MGGRTTPKADRPPTFDHLPAKQARRVRVPICFSEDAAEVLDGAERDFVLASDDSRAASQAALDQARADVEAATVVFVFEAIGPPAYRALVAAHPPSAEQLADYEAKLKEQAEKDLGEREFVDPPIFNLETFGPALIAASCISPRLTVEQLQVELESDRWNIAEVQALFDGAMAANTTRRAASAGKGSASIRG